MRLAKIGVSEKKSRLLPLKAIRTVLKFTIPTIVEDDEEFYDFYQDENTGRIYPKFTVQGNLDGVTF